MFSSHSGLVSEVKYILQRHLYVLVFRIVLFCLVAKRVFDQIRRYLRQRARFIEDEEDFRKMQEAAWREFYQSEKEQKDSMPKTESEEDAAPCLRRAKSPAILYHYARKPTSFQLEPRREEGKTIEQEQAEQETYPPLKELYSARIAEHQYLRQLRSELKKECGTLEAWQYLRDHFPEILGNDPTDPKLAVEEAVHDLPIGIAEQQDILQALAQLLLEKIYAKAGKDHELSKRCKKEAPIEEKVVLLVHELGNVCQRAFRAEEKRLEQTKLEEANRKDSAFTLEAE